jgi:energy-coupling factor transporter ATP-binding protein EcfA2
LISESVKKNDEDESTAIEIRGLTFTYENRNTPALKQINLKIKKGEFVLLAGQSGSGKSTLIRCINGLIPHRYMGEYTGEVIVLNHVVGKIGLHVLSSLVGTVFQEVEKQIVSPLVEDEVAFGPSNLALSRSEILRRVESSLNSMALSELRKRFTFELSGGQKQRVAIADILAMDPEIIIFDEPLANLDSEGVRLMLETFANLRKKGKTIIVSEHRTEEVLKAYPSRIIVIDEGRIAEDSTDSRVLSKFAGILKVPAEYLLGCDVSSLCLPEPRQIMIGKELISCIDVYVSYSGGIKALNGISLTIREGERVAILGNNGAGKSTLALAISGIIRPSSGKIFIKGKDSMSLTVGEIARTVAVVFQSPFLMLFSKTVRDELSFGPRNIGIKDEEIPEIINKVSKECGIDNLLEQSPYASSFGEKKRICVGSVLSMRPECIILDEPTAGQDYLNYTRFLNFIYSLDSVKSFVIITHDPDVALDYTDRTVVIHEGRIIADGATKDVLASREILEKAKIRETSLIKKSIEVTSGRSVLTTRQLVSHSFY